MGLWLSVSVDPAQHEHPTPEESQIIEMPDQINDEANEPPNERVYNRSQYVCSFDRDLDRYLDVAPSYSDHLLNFNDHLRLYPAN